MFFILIMTKFITTISLDEDLKVQLDKQCINLSKLVDQLVREYLFPKEGKSNVPK